MMFGYHRTNTKSKDSFFPQPLTFRVAMPEPAWIPKYIKAKPIIKKAEEGDAEAQMLLSRMYDNGIGVPRIIERRFYWLKRAMENGSLEAMTTYGAYCLMGNEFVPKDQKKAEELMQKAAEAGDAVAINNLGVLYYQLKNQPSKGLTYFEQAAALNNSRVLLHVAQHYLLEKTFVSDKNIEKCLNYLQRAADQQYGDAMLLLAGFYYNGQYVEENRKKAYALLERAADNTDSGLILITLALLNFQGEIIERNTYLARHFFSVSTSMKAPESMLAFAEQMVTMCDSVINADFLSPDEQIICAKGAIYMTDKKLKAKGRKILTKFANEGEPSAQWVLGEYFGWFCNGEEDEQAEFWLKKAASSGGAREQLSYAQFLLKNDLDAELALKLLETAKNADYHEAYFELGKLYYYGKGTIEKDYELALNFFQKALKLANSDPSYQHWLGEANFLLGLLYFKGQGTKANPSKALFYFSESWDYGYPEAAMVLSRMYSDGIVVEQDPHRAYTLIHTLVLLGHYEYCNRLGDYFLEGKVVPRDIYCALAFYQEGYENKYVGCASSIARFYFAGFDESRKPEDGYEIIKALVPSPDYKCMFTLGLMADYGYLRSKNQKEAVAFYRYAAKNNYLPCVINLCAAYALNEGGTADPSEIFALASKGATSGLGLALTNLAICYLEGIGTEKDEATARKYLEQAAEANDPMAKNYLEDSSANPLKFRKISTQDYLDFADLASGKTPNIAPTDPIDIESLSFGLAESTFMLDPTIVNGKRLFLVEFNIIHHHNVLPIDDFEYDVEYQKIINDEFTKSSREAITEKTEKEMQPANELRLKAKIHKTLSEREMPNLSEYTLSHGKGKRKKSRRKKR
ncbi:MAG: sel1 repeat family protein [Desulfovibrio sp.]|nr:sel1 repeat family protein [Desulfovibrio sp.]